MKKIKQPKSKFLYNPQYKRGYEMLQGVRANNALTSSAIREPYNSGDFDVISTEDAPALTYDELFSQYPALDENANPIDVKDGEVVEIGEDGSIDNTPWYLKPIKNWYNDTKNDVSIIANTNPLDIWRQTAYKQVSSHLSSIQNRLRETNWNIENSDEAKLYLNQIEKILRLQSDIERAKSYNNPTLVQKYQNDLNNEITALKSIELDIRTKWRDSDAFLDSFTDFDKWGQLKNTLDDTLRMVSPTRPKTDVNGIWNNIKNYAGMVLSSLTNTFSNLGYTVGDVLGLTENGGARIKNVIRNSNSDDSYINQTYFKSVLDVINDRKKLQEYKDNLSSNIQKLSTKYGRLKSELTADQLSTLNTVQNGNAFFDPRKIDPIYKKKQEANDLSLFDILNPLKWGYMLPELGSSYSDLLTTIAMLGNDAAFAYAGELLNPGKKGKLALGLLGIGSNLAIAKQQRIEETGSEVTDAYSQRLVNELYNNKNIDAGKVLNAIDLFSKTLSGLEFDPQELNLQEKMQLALSYNIKTGDPIFDKNAVQYRKGLQKVYNENMSLSTMDFVEALPFMSYTRSVVSDLASAPFNKLIGKVGQTKVGKYLLDTKSSIADKYNTVTRALTDKAITKMFGESVENAAKKLKTLHAAQWITDKFKKGMYSGFVEGVEEGQQQLLQNRYLRGEYDDYDYPQYDGTITNPFTLFDFPSALKDLDLATSSIFSYMGLNYGDPDNGSDELRKAMTTGALTGMIFSALYPMTINNIYRADMDPTNLRALQRQFKNDAVLGKLVAENYNKEQDDAHIAAFYNAMDKRGFNTTLLIKSLNDFKRFKGDLVDDEYIDKDVKLLTATNNLYHNPYLNGIIKDINASEEDKLKAVQNGVRAIVDYDRVANKVKEQGIAIDTRSLALYDIIDDMLSGKEQENAPQEIKQQRELLKPLVDLIIQSYDESSKDGKLNKETKKSEILSNENFKKEAKKKFEYDKKLNDAKTDEDKTKVNQEFDTFLDTEADKRADLLTSKASFVKTGLSNLLKIQQLVQMNKMIKMFAQKHDFAEHVEREFGIDLHNDRLGAILTQMHDIYKDILKQYSSTYNKALGNDEKSKNAVALEGIVESVKEFMPYLDQFSDLNNLFKSNIVNEALRRVYSPYVTAYTQGKADPTMVNRSMRRLPWKLLSQLDKDEFIKNHINPADNLSESQIKQKYLDFVKKEEDAFLKLKARNKKVNDAYYGKDEMERTVSDSEEYNKQIDEIQREAAKELIKLDVVLKKSRQRIAHERFLNEGAALSESETEETQKPKTELKSSSNTDETEAKPADNSEQQSQGAETEQTSTGDQMSQEGVDLLTQALTDEDSEIEDNLILNPEDSAEDLVNELLDGNRPKRKKETTLSEQKPVTKEDIVDASEDKPGVASTVNNDNTSALGTATNAVTDHKNDDTEHSNNENEGTNDNTDEKEDAIKTVVDHILTGLYSISDILRIPSGLYFTKFGKDDVCLCVENSEGTTSFCVYYAKNNEELEKAISTNSLYLLHELYDAPNERVPKGYILPDNIDAFNTLSIRKDVVLVAFIDSHGSMEGPVRLIKEGVHVDQDTDMSSSNNEKDTSDNDPNTAGLDQSDTETDDIAVLDAEDNKDTDNIDNSASATLSSTAQTNNNTGDNIENKRIEGVQTQSSEETNTNTSNQQDNEVDNAINDKTDGILEVLDDGTMMIGDDILTEELADGVAEDNDFQNGIEDGILDLSMDGVEYTQSGTVVDYDIEPKSKVYRDFLSLTFFYNPVATTPPRLNRGEEDVTKQLPYKLGTAKELSEKLLIPGWFNKAKKYYVVTADKNAFNSFDEDQYSVAMIIQDDVEKKCYASFMRATGKTDIYGNSKVEGLWNKLWKIGINPNTLIYNSILSAKLVSIYSIYHNGVIGTEEQATKWFDELQNDELKRTVINEVRRSVALPNQRPLTVEEIQRNIQQLKQRRHEIIDAYCEKTSDGRYIIPEKIRTDVLPKEPRISNGSIQSIPRKQGELPKWHVLFGEKQKLGIPKDIQEISSAINNGSVQFGYGSGMFGNDPFSILSINGPAQVFPGKGLAGKLYLIYTAANGKKIPLMLREQRFNTISINGRQERITQDNLELRIDPRTGKILEGKQPSAAEVLFYMLIGKLDMSYLPVKDASLLKKFVDIFVNNGESTVNTIGGSQHTLNKLSYYAKKKLYYDSEQGRLIMALPNNEGILTQTAIPINQLLDTTEQAQLLRLKIVFSIAENMHFNTDKEQLVSKIPSEILNALRSYFERNKTNLFSICGIPQFSFNREDLFDDNFIEKDVSTLAWMIKTGRLVSDISTSPLYAPFVYATGVEKTSTLKQVDAIEQLANNTSENTKSTGKTNKKSKAKKEKSDKKDTNKKRPLTSVIEATINRFISKYSKVDVLKRKNSILEDVINNINNLSELDYDSLKEYLNSKHVVEGQSNCIDVLIANVSGISGEENVKKAIKEKISSYIQLTGYEQLCKQKSGEKYKGVNINWPQLDLGKKDVPLIKFREDGTVDVYYMDVSLASSSIVAQSNNLKSGSNPISGLFSTVRGKGEVDTNKAKQWLRDTLGLSDELILAVGKLILNGEEKYGMVRRALGRVYDAVVILSEQAGEGIEYHEAWHYVNVLLHDTKTRDAIYREYAAQHNLSKDTSFKEIEELLAEEFRAYALTENSNRLKYKIKKYFNRMLNFLHVYKSKENIIHLIFKDINTGKYKNVRPNKDSLLYFEEKYNNHIESDFFIPGVNERKIEALKKIDTYQQFYQTAESIANMMIDKLAISKISDFDKITDDFFQKFMKDLYSGRNRDNEDVLTDIYNNKEVFYSILKETFKLYGIKVKIKKLKLLKKANGTIENESTINADEASTNEEDDIREKADIGDTPDNVWDRFSFSISKKDNVAFRAKLFLSHVPKARLYLSENGNEKQIEYITDPLLGCNTYMSFSEAWTKVISELWDIDSYGVPDKVGNYPITSLRGKIKQRAKNEWFYRVLDEKLDDIDDEGDTELQTLIYVTIKSQNAQMAQIWLQDPQNKFTATLFDEDVIGDDEFTSANAQNDTIDDVLREWKIVNDNALRAKRSLPREWSNSAVLSGLISVRNGNTIIDPAFVNTAVSMFDNIKKLCKEDKKLKGNQYTREKYEEVYNGLIDLLNFLCIPCDEDVLELLIDEYASRNLYDMLSRWDALRNIINNSKEGTVLSIVTMLKKSAGLQNLVVGKSSTKDPYKIFMQYKDDSLIIKIAELYNRMHPASLDFSVKGPDGSMHYPINQNNHMSDAIRLLNTDPNAIAMKMRSPYARHSLLFTTALNNQRTLIGENAFKLNAFIGLKDTRKQEGKDYFGISYMEDYLCKMNLTFNNMLVLPTMADKKTWYAILQKLLKLPHDLILYNTDNFTKLLTMDVDETVWNPETKTREKTGNKVKATVVAPYENFPIQAMRFSDTTLDIFVGYFMDEIETLKQYYSRDNIAYLKKHKNLLRANYHGKFVKNSNGEERMTFTGNGGLFRYMYDIYKYKGLNLNQLLEARYEQQKYIELNAKDEDGINLLRAYNTDSGELDGFESVRHELDLIEKHFSNDGYTETIRSAINEWLLSRVTDEIDAITKPTVYKLGHRDPNTGHFIADAIPSLIMNEYIKLLSERVPDLNIDSKNAYSNQNILDSISLSAIANHAVSEMISVIELEKAFAGDPAFYKWKYLKLTQEFTLEDIPVNIRVLKEKDTDKIKRLGALLSPGDNVRTDYDELTKQELGVSGDKYTTLTLKDFELKSNFIDTIVPYFLRLAAVNALRSLTQNGNKIEMLDEYIAKNHIKDYETLFDKIISGTDKLSALLVYDKFMDPKNHDKKFKKYLESFKEIVDKSANAQCSPYGVDDNSLINVSDALVVIRPEMYRRIRIGIGRWSDEDELAYKLIEEDGDWMHDPEKARIVSKLQLFPLKMSYFQNDPVIWSAFNKNKPQYYNLPIYNKMAIFPMFKYMTLSTTGKVIYERMNRKGGEIDMLVFESAVKVGSSQNKASSLPESLKKLSQGTSSVRIDENNNVIKTRDTKDSLPIEVQSLNGLRMQLNTDAHLAEERSIGTQMSKIAFSNVIDDHYYGKRKGRAVKHDIMNCINALTEIGTKAVVDEFEIQRGIADRKKMHDYVKRIVISNGLGTPSQLIIDNNGVAASLTSRRVFENGVSSLVNGEVVDIETKGGSAIQQSIFGLTGFDKDHMVGWEQDGFRNLNDGKEIKWLSKKNTMEVMLSINFFRAILPNDLQNAPFAERRQWLVDHDIIYGKKTSTSSTESAESNPSAIGIGYRIPTQGQSSMFGFICADVLPETSGDLIIVPREFTAQTGSDFDVDKLFIAMKSYTNGVYDDFTDEEYARIKEIYENKPKDGKKLANVQNEVTKYLAERGKKGALLNKLIQNYLDILLDDATFADARGSIDTITGKIKKELLPLLQMSETDYRKAGYELLPSFQLRRKMEFTTGKSGIGAFALNVTNIALTLFANLTLHYTSTVAPFNFGDLNESIGQDGLSIAGWLSAMVNAHVDVAKDPYIFDMNINSATYDYVNFLIRAGKGLSTFTFMALPAIKLLADLLQNTHNMYGDNIKSRKTNGAYKRPIDVVRNDYINALKSIDVNAIKDELLRLLITAAKSNNLRGSIKETGIDWNKQFTKVFDINYAKQMLKKPTTLDEYAEQLCFLMICISAWEKIEPYASEMSSLVKMSRIDTKKFGNNIAEHINFLNSYNNFIYGHRRVKWYIKDGTTRKSSKEIKEFEEAHGRNYALERYFNSTFLDSKLKNSTKLTRTVLRNQLCTATENFEDIFKSFAYAINGGETLQREYVGKDDKIHTESVYVYNPIVNAEVVSSISQAIDNIMRYYILRATPAKQDQEEGLIRGIDFTCKNNPKEVRKQFSRLMFGDPEGSTEYMRNSIFKNLSLLIDDLQHPKDSEMDKRVLATGLVDDDGKITNDLLNFLRPQTASSKYPVGRMLLAKSSFGITGQEESKLISAFDQLLKSPNNRVRMIARDLVFYAYYSQYDVNSQTSFFKLVPYRYRIQYDKALAYALQQNTSRLYEILSNTEKQGLSPEETEARTVDEFIDNMCRNYWYDDNIVPVLKTYPSYKELSLNNDSSTIQLFTKTHLYKKEFVNFPVQHDVLGIILSKFSGGSPYVKVQKGKDWYLYKNIGTITRTDNSGEKEKISTYNVYAVIQKRGVHEDGKHLFEYATERDDVSIFKSNMLPDTLSLTETKNSKGLLNMLSEYIAKLQASAPTDKNKQALVKYEISLILPNVIKQFNGYTDTNTTNSSITKTNDGAIIFEYAKPIPAKDLNDGETFFQHYVKIKKKAGWLTLDISSSLDIDKQINELISKYKVDPESKTIRTYTLIVYGDIKSVNIDNAAVNNYIKQLRLDYENFLLADDPNINKELLKKQVEDYVLAIDTQKVIDTLSLARINARLQLYLDKLTAGGVLISTYVSDGSQGVGEATLRYAQKLHAENGFITGRMVIENKKDKVSTDSAIELATKYNDQSGLLYLSNDEYSQLKTFSKIVSDATETVDLNLENISDISEQGAGALLNFIGGGTASSETAEENDTNATLTNIDDNAQTSDIDPGDSIGGDALLGILSGNSATETTDTTHIKGC